MSIYTPILVLDKNFLPCQISSGKDIIPLLVTDKAKVLSKTYEQFSFLDWIKYSQEYLTSGKPLIKSVNFSFLVPEVVILLDFLSMRRQKSIKLNRTNIFKRDSNICQYCGRKIEANTLTIDHVVPKSKGGANTWDNLTTACFKCNTKKGNKLLEETGMNLLKKPRIPTYKHLIERARGPSELWDALLVD